MSSLNKLSDFKKALSLISKHGHYDHCLIGALAEAYAEEVLNMEKAPKGIKGYDGVIDGRKVQVKAKKPIKEKPLSKLYVAISHSNEGLADDLIVVIYDWDKEDWYHIGPVPIEGIKFTPNKTQKRYTINNIKKAFESYE